MFSFQDKKAELSGETTEEGPQTFPFTPNNSYAEGALFNQKNNSEVMEQVQGRLKEHNPDVQEESESTSENSETVLEDTELNIDDTEASGVKKEHSEGSETFLDKNENITEAGSEKNIQTVEGEAEEAKVHKNVYDERTAEVVLDDMVNNLKSADSEQLKEIVSLDGNSQAFKIAELMKKEDSETKDIQEESTSLPDESTLESTEDTPTAEEVLPVKNVYDEKNAELVLDTMIETLNSTDAEQLSQKVSFNGNTQAYNIAKQIQQESEKTGAEETKDLDAEEYVSQTRDPETAHHQEDDEVVADSKKKNQNDDRARDEDIIEVSKVMTSHIISKATQLYSHFYCISDSRYYSDFDINKLNMTYLNYKTDDKKQAFLTDANANVPPLKALLTATDINACNETLLTLCPVLNSTNHVTTDNVTSRADDVSPNTASMHVRYMLSTCCPHVVVVVVVVTHSKNTIITYGET